MKGLAMLHTGKLASVCLLLLGVGAVIVLCGIVWCAVRAPC